MSHGILYVVVDKHNGQPVLNVNENNLKLYDLSPLGEIVDISFLENFSDYLHLEVKPKSVEELESYIEYPSRYYSVVIVQPSLDIMLFDCILYWKHANNTSVYLLLLKTNEVKSKDFKTGEWYVP